MKLIAITWPEILPEEGDLIDLLFENGIDYLHLRKPDVDVGVQRCIMEAISPKWYSRIVVHDHYELVSEYSLAGFHLNQRNSNRKGVLFPHSCSSHSIEELKKYDHEVKAYQFLSPVFDSISKSGYRSAYSDIELKQAAQEGIIQERVVALGGITPQNIRTLSAYNFGGAALLGGLWEPFLKERKKNVLLETLEFYREQIY